MTKDTWLIVADASIARMFKIIDQTSLICFETLKHSESRKQNLDLVTDKPGRSFESSNVSRHGVGGANTPKKHEGDVFSKEVSDYLERAYNSGEVQEIYLVAAPNFLGLIRNHLSSAVQKAIVGELDKGITHLTQEEIWNYIPFFKAHT